MSLTLLFYISFSPCVSIYIHIRKCMYKLKGQRT